MPDRRFKGEDPHSGLRFSGKGPDPVPLDPVPLDPVPPDPVSQRRCSGRLFKDEDPDPLCSAE